MGGQSQDAIDEAIFYGHAHRRHEAAEVLRMVERSNKDPWGTSPLFYYTLAKAVPILFRYAHKLEW